MMGNYFIRGFPGSPEVKIPHFIGSILGQGTKIPHATGCDQEKKYVYVYIYIYIYTYMCVCLYLIVLTLCNVIFQLNFKNIFSILFSVNCLTLNCSQIWTVSWKAGVGLCWQIISSPLGLKLFFLALKWKFSECFQILYLGVIIQFLLILCESFTLNLHSSSKALVPTLTAILNWFPCLHWQLAKFWIFSVIG